MAEKIITLGKRGDLHARRQALAFVFDPKVVKKVFDEIGPRMRTRPGGYTRITALEPRKGDNARISAIELIDFVDAPPTPRPQRVTASPAAATRATAAAPATAVADAPAAIDEAPEVVATVESEAIEPVAAEAPNAEGDDAKA